MTNNQYEHTTTYCSYELDYYPRTEPEPIYPEGDGWELISTCCSEKYVFYTWKRNKKFDALK